MVNEVQNNWPLVTVLPSDVTVLRKDPAVQFTSERRNELINDENNVPSETFYFREKGVLIDIFA